MATTTTNLGMTLVSGEELFDTDKVMENFEKVDEAVGKPSSLETDNKTSVVAAVNELHTELEQQNVNLATKNLRTYTNFTQFGMEEAGTVTEIMNAMPAPSELVLSISNTNSALANSLPVKGAGKVHFSKSNNSSRGVVEYTNFSSNIKYRASYYGGVLSDWVTYDEIDFSCTELSPNYVCINSGISNYGICYRIGKIVYLKAYFAAAFFTAGKDNPLFYIPDGYRPTSSTTGIMSCGRHRTDGVATLPIDEYKINVSIDTNGCIYQEFNSDGDASSWYGEITAMYACL